MSLPPGKLHLVDNRIVAGESSWAGQPTTVAILHPKQTKPEHRAALKALIEVANAARHDGEADTPPAL